MVEGDDAIPIGQRLDLGLEHLGAHHRPVAEHDGRSLSTVDVSDPADLVSVLFVTHTGNCIVLRITLP